jgi:hypothetical protein
MASGISPRDPYGEPERIETAGPLSRREGEKAKRRKGITYERRASSHNVFSLRVFRVVFFFTHFPFYPFRLFASFFKL